MKDIKLVSNVLSYVSIVQCQYFIENEEFFDKVVTEEN